MQGSGDGRRGPPSPPSFLWELSLPCLPSFLLGCDFPLSPLGEVFIIFWKAKVSLIFFSQGKKINSLCVEGFCIVVNIMCCMYPQKLPHFLSVIGAW